MRVVGRVLPEGVRTRLKKRLEKTHDWRKRRRLGVLSEGDLRAALVEAGVPGHRVVMVHAAMGRIHRWVPTISPRGVVELVLDLLGPEGTLLVPTFPFTGSQSVYAHRQPVFDVAATPSALGVLTEAFRSMPGVIRSRHPTHAVAGIGPRAAELLGGHDSSSTFGPGSPFHRLTQIEALVVGIGVGFTSGFTVFHTGEAMHPWSGVNSFEKTPVNLDVIDGPERLSVPVRCLRARLPYSSASIEAFALSHGFLHYRHHAGLLVSHGAAGPFVTGIIEAIEAGQVYRAGAAWPPA